MKRNVITGYNSTWVIGYCEERPSEDVDWERVSHSDFVFSISPERDASGNVMGEAEPIPVADRLMPLDGTPIAAYDWRGFVEQDALSGTVKINLR